MNYTELPNVASALLGAKILFATDEWFAAADNLVRVEEPVFIATEFTHFGKWMDGWETRRRRTEGHDWCIVKLGLPAVIKAIEVDTAFFTGNFSPQASIYGSFAKTDSAAMKELMDIREQSVEDRPEYKRMGLCATDKEWSLVSTLKSEDWPVLVPLTPLGAGYPETRKNIFHIDGSAHGPITYLRLNMGPDGGIARLRVYGEVVVHPERLPQGRDFDLAAVEHGGLALAWSNKHYGHPNKLLEPGRGTCMGDGWETARQPARPPVYRKGTDGLMELPGFDWALLKLGVPGVISQLEVDTAFFRGNYPESCMVEGCFLPAHVSSDDLVGEEGEQARDSLDWQVLLPRSRLTPDERHFFSVADGKLNSAGPISHVRVTMYPDGGIMRFRVYGRSATESTRSRL